MPGHWASRPGLTATFGSQRAALARSDGSPSLATSQSSSSRCRLAGSAGPRGPTAGPDGNIWFVDAGRGGIGRLSFPQPAVMTTPAPQSTLEGATATFTWNPTNGATQYWLDLGTSPHGTDLYSAS